MKNEKEMMRSNVDEAEMIPAGSLDLTDEALDSQGVVGAHTNPSECQWC